jgi:nucleoside-diphosphate-sugar epimerase
MKVLITGGSGFLGLHLTRYFHKKKYQISIIDIQEYPEDEYPKNINFIHGDIRDNKAVAKAMRGVDLVIHAAAALPLWKAEDIYTTNIDGTENILSASKRAEVRQIIYISSTAVYGIPKKHPIFETDPVHGVGPYGESKIAAEAICKKYRDGGMNVTVLRPKTFVGTHRLGVFEILFDWIKDGKKIPVFGSGKNRYQLLDVDDLVEAIYRLTKAGKKASDTFNIGALSYKTVQKDLESVFAFSKSGSQILPIPALPLKLALRFFEALHISPLYKWVYETADKDSFVSINKLIKTLGWKPKYSNSDALIKSYKWYLENYKAVKSHSTGVTHTTGWNQGILGFFKKFL